MMSDSDFLSFSASGDAPGDESKNDEKTLDGLMKERKSSMCVCVSRGMSVFFFFFFMPTDNEEASYKLAINIRKRI